MVVRCFIHFATSAGLQFSGAEQGRARGGGISHAAMLSQACECCREPLGGVLTGVLDCSVSFCSHIFKRLSRSLSSCSLKLRSRSSFFSLSRVASISHLRKGNSVSRRCRWDWGHSVGQSELGCGPGNWPETVQRRRTL